MINIIGVKAPSRISNNLFISCSCFFNFLIFFFLGFSNSFIYIYLYISPLKVLNFHICNSFILTNIYDYFQLFCYLTFFYFFIFNFFSFLFICFLQYFKNWFYNFELIFIYLFLFFFLLICFFCYIYFFFVQPYFIQFFIDYFYFNQRYNLLNLNVYLNLKDYILNNIKNILLIMLFISYIFFFAIKKPIYLFLFLICVIPFDLKYIIFIIIYYVYFFFLRNFFYSFLKNYFNKITEKEWGSNPR